MHNSSATHALFFVALSGLTACTAGRVLDRGSPVVGATVTFDTCGNGTYTTATGSGGQFSFNPFDPAAAVLHAERQVPAGFVLVTVKIPGRPDFKVGVDHRYNQTCSTLYAGTYQNLPCALYELEVSPTLSPVEQSVRQAETASAIATCVQRRAEATLAGVINKL